jgi:hypothetical protein
MRTFLNRAIQGTKVARLVLIAEFDMDLFGLIDHSGLSSQE